MSIIQGHAKSSGVTSFYPTTIDQSLRFEDGDSPYLNQTFSAGDDEKIFTFSAWVKRGNLGAGSDTIFGVGANNTNDGQFYFNSSNQLGFFGRASSSTKADLVTTQVFRDTSSWYHLVVAVDTTEATAADRVKLYVNGEQVTAFDSSTYPSLNDTMTFNGASVHYLGKARGDVNPDFDGYLAEVHFTDGTAYTADAFGEFKSGIWVPKAPSVTYGTNGFKLTFEDSAAIGDDTSGNGNDWTVNNLVASDVVLDSPTNNFAVLNPVSKNGSEPAGTKEGNTHFIITGGSNYCSLATTVGSSSGKWYCEGVIKSSSAIGSARTGGGVLRFDDPRNDFIGAAATGWGYGSNGTLYNLGGNVTGATSLAVNDVFMLAIDLDAGKMWVGKNGTWESSGDPAAGTGEQFSNLTGAGEYFFGAWGYTTSDITAMNFGQDSTFAGLKTAGGNSDDNGIGDFAYAPPSGYLALCTSNLPDPVIDPAQDATPEDYFNVVTYTGNGTTQSITGVGFQPDWVWTKDRENTRNHALFDVVRGVTKRLLSDGDNAEGTVSGVDSFDSDGVTLGGANPTNGNNIDYVGWFWKAGGTGVSNTDGSITSTVSANTDAGFSIVSYTGNGTAGATVGHGLDSAPEMYIVKNRDQTAPWQVYHQYVSSDPETDNLVLNTSAAVVDNLNRWNDTAPTTTVFSLGDGGSVNTNTEDHIAYCFHSVDGFSKFGAYTSNQNSDGPFIYTGFRPRWVLVKRSSAGTDNWGIFDSERDIDNRADLQLRPNLSNAERTIDGIDFLSNGFKLRTTNSDLNGTASTYIFYAISEQPFKYSNAR